jgi:hypothetical protein
VNRAQAAPEAKTLVECRPPWRKDPWPGVNPLPHRPAALHQYNEALGDVLARPQPAGCIRQCVIPIIGCSAWGDGCGQYGRPTAGRCGRFAVVGAAGPGGAEQADKRSARTPANICRGCARFPSTGFSGMSVQPAPCHPREAGSARRQVAYDVIAAAHGHARPCPANSPQIDRVLGQLRLGQVNAESHASQQGQPEETIWTGPGPRPGPVQHSDAARPSRCVVAL